MASRREASVWVRVCVCVRVCVWCSVPWEVHGCGGVVVVVVTGEGEGRGKGKEKEKRQSQ